MPQFWTAARRRAIIGAFQLFRCGSAMEVSAIPEFGSLPTDQDSECHVLVRLQAPASEAPETQRVPIHLALVLDRSGSMGGQPLDEAKHAASSFAKWLTREDFLSVVAFDDEVDLIVPHQQLLEKDAIDLEIQRIEAGNTTNLSGGWLQGLTELRRNFTEGHIHRVVLLTDGLANRGVTAPDKLREIASKNRERHITTTTVGFGPDFSEDVLQAIAEDGDGSFHYVDEPEALAETFRKEFGDLVALVGQNLELSLKTSAGVTVTEVLGDWSGAHTANALTARFGDIRTDELKQLIAKLRVCPGEADAQEPIAEITVRYDSVVGEMEPFGATHPIVVDFSGVSGPDEEVLQEVWTARGIRLRLAAKRALDKGEGLEGIARRLLRHADALDQMRMPSRRLREEQARLRDLADSLQNQNRDLNDLRKTMTHESFTMTRTIRAVVRGADELEGEFGPDRPENLIDISDRLVRAMEDKGYDKDLCSRARQILRELGENAIEHGCRGDPDIQARARCIVGGSYVRVIVEDDGPGFDLSATLESLRQQVTGPSKRGRGLILVESLADHLRHSRSGNRIEAVIRREAVRLNIEVPSRTKYDFHEDIVVVKLAGSLDSANLPDVEKMLNTLVMEGWTRIVLNAEKVDYISSLGVGVFLSFQSKLENCAGMMVLAAPSEPIRQILNVLGLTSVVPVVDTVDEGIKYLS